MRGYAGNRALSISKPGPMSRQRFITSRATIWIRAHSTRRTSNTPPPPVEPSSSPDACRRIYPSRDRWDRYGWRATTSTTSRTSSRKRFHLLAGSLPQHVVSGLSLKEVNNRTWESFRFSCRDIAPDGGMVGTAQKSDFLFNFEREGQLYEVTSASQHLTFGIFELANALTGSKSLLQIALEQTGAAAIHAAGTNGRHVDDVTLSEKIPDAFGLGGMPRVDHWTCPRDIESGTGPDLTSGRALPRPHHRCRTGLLKQSPKRRFDLR